MTSPSTPSSEVDWVGTAIIVQEIGVRKSGSDPDFPLPDGTTPILIGPEAPPGGWEANWIKSIPGRAWFPYFRFYGPKQPYFDQSWQLPPIEEIDFANLPK